MVKHNQTIRRLLYKVYSKVIIIVSVKDIYRINLSLKLFMSLKFFSAKILCDKNYVYIGGADALPKGSMLLLESARQLANLFWGLTAP